MSSRQSHNNSSSIRTCPINSAAQAALIADSPLSAHQKNSSRKLSSVKSSSDEISRQSASQWKTSSAPIALVSGPSNISVHQSSSMSMAIQATANDIGFYSTESVENDQSLQFNRSNTSTAEQIHEILSCFHRQQQRDGLPPLVANPDVDEYHCDCGQLLPAEYFVSFIASQSENGNDDYYASLWLYCQSKMLSSILTPIAHQVLERLCNSSGTNAPYVNHRVIVPAISEPADDTMEVPNNVVDEKRQAEIAPKYYSERINERIAAIIKTSKGQGTRAERSKRFNVSDACIKNIDEGKSWKKVKPATQAAVDAEALSQQNRTCSAPLVLQHRPIPPSFISSVKITKSAPSTDSNDRNKDLIRNNSSSSSPGTTHTVKNSTELTLSVSLTLSPSLNNWHLLQEDDENLFRENEIIERMGEESGVALSASCDTAVSRASPRLLLRIVTRMKSKCDTNEDGCLLFRLNHSMMKHVDDQGIYRNYYAISVMWKFYHQEVSATPILRTCENPTCIEITHLTNVRQRWNFDKLWTRLNRTAVREIDGPFVNGVQCLLWTEENKGEDGLYGIVKVQDEGIGRSLRVHRVSYSIKEQLHDIPLRNSNGELLDVCHQCKDRSLCFEQAHLILGTRTKNNQDKIRDGNSGRGEKSLKATITEELAQEIKWSICEESECDEPYYESITDRADRFQVSYSMIYHIDRGFSWYWLPDRHGIDFQHSQRPIVTKALCWTVKQWNAAEQYLESHSKQSEFENRYLGTYCNEFTGRTFFGYGQIGMRRKIGAHVLACELKNRQFHTSDQKTRHLCANRICCKRSHVSFGSDADNAKDGKIHREMDKQLVEIEKLRTAGELDHIMEVKAAFLANRKLLLAINE
jgi:hypothetical protein